LIGKWHLGLGEDQSQLDWPHQSGYDYFAGSIGNFGYTEYSMAFTQEELQEYRNFAHWLKVVNEVVDETVVITEIKNDTYATTDNVDDARDWINQASTGDKPWFLMLAFNAAHAPFHVPPHDLHSYDEKYTQIEAITDPSVKCGNEINLLCYHAMIEAMDSEIERLFEEIGTSVLDKTTIIFVADNGTPMKIFVPPFDTSLIQDDYIGRAKGSVHQGGVNVPLIISGAGVKKKGKESYSLVNTTDIFSTVLELAIPGINIPEAVNNAPLDSSSLLAELNSNSNTSRTTAYTERFVYVNGVLFAYQSAMRDNEYKLIDRIAYALSSVGGIPISCKEGLYHLTVDPYETAPLDLNNLDCNQISIYNNFCNQLKANLAAGDDVEVPSCISLDTSGCE